MITPKFSCSQTDTTLSIRIYCPAVRASDLEICVNDSLVTIHINPYFLRLSFSGGVLGEEDDNDNSSSAAYDAASGYLTVTLTKQSPGQVFQDLDLLAKLLAPPQPPTPAHVPTIEVLDDDSQQNEGEEMELIDKTSRLEISSDKEEYIKAAMNDWQVLQEVPSDSTTPDLPRKYYGFLDSYTGYFLHVAHSDNEVNDLGVDAEQCPPSERVRRMKEREDTKWDEEHYMADYIEDEMIEDLIEWQHPLLDNSSETSSSFTEEETMAMLKLPRKEYLISDSQNSSLYLALTSILFAYAYETRSNQLDPSPESAWTMCILVPLFSALASPILSTQSASYESEDLTSTLTSSYRRSLAFPLYRSWRFSERCRRDVSLLFGRGRRTIIKCLLWMKNVLDHHEVYYIYSKIWMDDLCVWIQTYATEDKLRQLSKGIGTVNIRKEDIGWDLEELEAAAREMVSSAESRQEDSDDE